MNNFAKALDVVLHHEGGYVNHPNDPGGETIYGISRRSHPDVWAKGRPSIDDAKRIYHRDYWLPIKADALPLPVALMVFDTAVNSGNRRAVMLLQRALRVSEDGVIGPVTLAAANKADTRTLVNHIAAERITFNSSLSNWGSFGLGWSRRVVDVAVTAVQLIK
ncbi:peptidoglycan-binding protein [Alishewanella sp. 16-MA]|uniref:Peptidoglycan-binding protein n=1 Tax=Alishewanella maricola TaxID=2795740 RepID=A0ABS8C249_9ALTE|nr:glycosyl hydrolase 108 family protein [Alishewanella maricola]MCB5226215.1 peptidoglycan-binding protein [Alishewanella maricola]